MIATPLSPFCLRRVIDSYSHRNKIFLVGRHQEVRRSVSPGLHHITSVIGMSRNEKHTSTSFALLLRNPATILCHKQLEALRMAMYCDQYPRAARNGGEIW